MNYISTSETAKRWGVSERAVREYCAKGRVVGAFLTGNSWNVPDGAEKPVRTNARAAEPRTLPEILAAEQAVRRSGGIYHKVQVDLTYNSNHIEGSRLTRDQTRYIFETNTIDAEKAINVDDIVETANHFRCVDMIISQAGRALSEKLIKDLHLTLKSGTSDARLGWLAPGGYKQMPNEVGGMETTAPEHTAAAVKSLLADYGTSRQKTLEEIVDFHARFEAIHPFQDGNGRVGRLIMFKECLRCGVVPFIIDDGMKMFYYRGLHEWRAERGCLLETCRAAQDRFKEYLDYFRIPY